MTRQTVTIYNAQAGHVAWVELWQWCKAMLLAGHRLVVTVRGETRPYRQNNMMWSCLGDISEQVQWVIDGKLCYPSDKDWKEIPSAGLKKNTARSKRH